MPITGGLIQFANLPGSTTRPIRLATKARSSAVGSHSLCRACHSASLTTRPSGDSFRPANAPIWRLKALCGTDRRVGMPAFSMTLFQRFTPATESLMKSSRSTSFSALSIGTSLSTSWPFCTSSTR